MMSFAKNAKRELMVMYILLVGEEANMSTQILKYQK